MGEQVNKENAYTNYSCGDLYDIWVFPLSPTDTELRRGSQFNVCMPYWNCCGLGGESEKVHGLDPVWCTGVRKFHPIYFILFYLYGLPGLQMDDCSQKGRPSLLCPHRGALLSRFHRVHPWEAHDNRPLGTDMGLLSFYEVSSWLLTCRIEWHVVAEGRGVIHTWVNLYSLCFLAIHCSYTVIIRLHFVHYKHMKLFHGIFHNEVRGQLSQETYTKSHQRT